MEVILLTFGIFLCVIFAMSIGYIIKRKTIKGSCGGISTLGLKKACDCPEPCDEKKRRMEEAGRHLYQIQEPSK